MLCMLYGGSVIHFLLIDLTGTGHIPCYMMTRRPVRSMGVPPIGCSYGVVREGVVKVNDFV